MLSRTPRLIPEEADFRPALALRFLPGANGTHMTTMSYGEQLKHPFWQRKRLKVLQRADFKCEACRSDEKTLHVHHKRYVKGRMAWEYEAHELAALCEDCHRDAHADMERLMEVVAQLDCNGPERMRDAEDVLSGWFAGQLLKRGFEHGHDHPSQLVTRNAAWMGRQLLEAVDAKVISEVEMCSIADLLQEPYVSRLRSLIEEWRADVARQAAGPSTTN